MYSIYTQYYIIVTLLFSFINLDHMESYLYKYDLWRQDLYFRRCLVTKSFINLDHMESYLYKYDLWRQDLYFRRCLVTKIFTPKCILSKQGRVLILSINLHM